jgi:YHS domain-containing protein
MARLIFYLIDLIVLLYVLRRFAQAILHLLGQPRAQGRSSNDRRSKQVVQGETARDPVCGMFVSTEVSQRLVLSGRTLHFCSRECLERYQSKSA